MMQDRNPSVTDLREFIEAVRLRPMTQEHRDGTNAIRGYVVLPDELVTLQRVVDYMDRLVADLKKIALLPINMRWVAPGIALEAVADPEFDGEVWERLTAAFLET